MQLLGNSSLDLLWSGPFFNLSGRTHPLRECRDCARWNQTLQGRSHSHTVSLILFLHRQLMWGPLTPNSNQPAVVLSADEENITCAYWRRILLLPLAEQRARNFRSRVRKLSVPIWPWIHRKSHPSFKSYSRWQWWGVYTCICACAYMLWRGDNLPREVQVIFWIQIEWKGWLPHENRTVTSQ